MCYQMSLYPKTMSNWISKLPLCSFPSSQFAYGLGDWEAFWDGDPLLQIGILERFSPPSRSLAGPHGAAGSKYTSKRGFVVQCHCDRRSPPSPSPAASSAALRTLPRRCRPHCSIPNLSRRGGEK